MSGHFDDACSYCGKVRDEPCSQMISRRKATERCANLHESARAGQVQLQPAVPVVRSRHGCCVDKACTDKTCMALPDGKTCGDCKHMTHCKAFYGHKPEDTSCDFFPRRFAPARPPATQPVEHRIQIGPLDI